MWRRTYFQALLLLSWALPNILKLRCWPLAFTSHNIFFKYEKGSGSSLQVFVSKWFWRKPFFMLYSINSPNFIVWLPLRLEILSNMYIVIICVAFYHIINFKTASDILTKTFFYMPKKVTTKKLNILVARRAFDVK